MKMLGLKARIRRKRKYSSYHGTVGRELETLFNANLKLQNRWKSAIQTLRNFLSQQVTKLYLSPILDGYNKGNYSLFPFVFTQI